MTFPVAHTVTRHPYVGTTKSGAGNTVPSFGPAVQVGVYAIAPHTVEEGSATRTEIEVADLDVFMPKTPVSVKDKFTFEGGVYETVGVKDWTLGFHGWEPGIVVELRRVS